MKILNAEHSDEGWLPDKTGRERLLRTLISPPPPQTTVVVAVMMWGGLVIFGGIFASTNLRNEC